MIPFTVSPADAVLARDVVTPAARAELFARVRRDDFVALYRGVYLDSAYWAGLGPTQKHHARIQAVARIFGADLVFSHLSAAALWRLPSVGPWPDQVHASVGPSDARHEGKMLVRHVSSRENPGVEIAGHRVTTLARTVVDLAASLPFARAVVFADAALRLTDSPKDGVPLSGLIRADLEREARDIPPRRGSAKARGVIAFADGRADRPGESLSRVSMRVAGVPVPRLQEPLRGASGKRYEVDFWWPEFRLIGEFDGKVKCTSAEFASGRDAAQIVYDEKLREDDLRAAGHGMCRWPWAVAISPHKLRERLTQAGLRL